MENDLYKEYYGYEDMLKERIETKKKMIKIRKEYIKEMNEYEYYLDREEKEPVEDMKKRKKYGIVGGNWEEDIKIEEGEVIEDLDRILDTYQERIHVIDNSLFINMEKFVKGEKVKLDILGEEYYGSIFSVNQSDVVIKTREVKKIRVKIISLRRGDAKITKRSIKKGDNHQ